MTDRGRADRRGIEIPADVADAAGMPADLDANVIGEYSVPDTARRRIAGRVYVVAAAVTAVAGSAGLGSAMWVLTAFFAAVAVYHRLAGPTLEVREREALDLANEAAGFPVGHAAASLGFDGPLARPVWNVLVFSADDPPSRRGLVRVEARTGAVVEQYVERVDAASA